MFDEKKEAIEIVKKYVDPFIASGHANCLYSDVCGEASKAIESSLLRAFNAGLEAAAQTSEDLFDHRNESRRTAYLDGEFTIDHSNAGDSIASAIRNLKKPERMKGV